MNNNNYLLTVYCLTYNHENYIEDALKGFVSQKTNFKYKVLVHDDCSTDKTVEVIRRYAEKYPDIIFPILQSENQYSKDSNIVKEFIVPKFEGKYIAMCEGDDYWIDSNKLQKQVDFLENHSEYSACVHNSEVLNCRFNTRKLLNSNTNDYDIEFSEIIKGGNQSYQMSSLVCRRELDELYHSDQRPEYLNINCSFGDYPLGIFLCLNGKMRYISEVMSVYRLMTPNSWTSRNRNVNAVEKNYNSIKELLIGVDNYTEQKYHEAISNVLRRNEFNVLLIKKNLKELKSGKYLDLWNELSVSNRIKIYIKKVLKID